MTSKGDCSAASSSLSVNPLAGRPTRDGDGQILHSRRAVFITVNERVRQELLIIPLGKAGAGVPREIPCDAARTR